jgi:hypothetical protein
MYSILSYDDSASVTCRFPLGLGDLETKCDLGHTRSPKSTSTEASCRQDAFMLQGTSSFIIVTDWPCSRDGFDDVERLSVQASPNECRTDGQRSEWLRIMTFVREQFGLRMAAGLLPLCSPAHASFRSQYFRDIGEKETEGAQALVRKVAPRVRARAVGSHAGQA